MSSQVQVPLVKQIRYTYDPIAGCQTSQEKLSSFDFLRYDISTTGFRTYQNSVAIDPESLPLPWPSLFPAGRQCKHWKAAENGARDLLRAIYEVGEDERGKLPEGFGENLQPEGRSKKAEAFITTAADATMYMNPESSATRIALITKFYLLAWLQDDVTEFDSSRKKTTAVDIIIRGWPDIVANPDINITSPDTISTSIAHDMISESPVLGRGVMKAFCAFIFSQPRTEFSGFRDFLEYRAVNVATEFILACVRFANDVELSPEESSVLDKFVQLFTDHCLLINDLYSFDKEKKEFEEQGALISNTVYYLESTLSIHPNTAKLVALDLIRELEVQLEAEFSNLRSNGLSQQQLNYACALLECLAGNIVFSATSKRYGGSSAKAFQVEDNIHPSKQGLLTRMSKGALKYLKKA